MARPKKDPLVPAKPKVFDVAKLPLGPGRVLILKYPLGGFQYNEIEFVRKYLSLLQADQQVELSGPDDRDE